jgi:aldose sugar dehydrogenase
MCREVLQVLQRRMWAFLAICAVACHRTDPDCDLEPEGTWGPLGTELVFYEEVASRLAVPWGLAFLPDGDLLATEREGRIRRVHLGVLEVEPMATPDVDESSGGGLLGIAVDPRFDNNHGVYVFETYAGIRGPLNRVSRYVVEGKAALRDEVILDGIPTGAGHDGGRLWFDDAGLLYVATGDAGVPDLAQDPESLAGKILRVAPDVKPYEPEVFALGLRNPVGLDGFGDGRVLVADGGPEGEVRNWDGYDEVDLAKEGTNFGWPDVHACTERDEDTAPLLTWSDALGPGALHRLAGGAIDAFEGDVFVTALEGQHLQRVRLVGGDAGSTPTVERHDVFLAGSPPDGFGRLRDVAQGPDGFLYVTTSNCDGEGDCPADGDKIVRIRP